MPTPSPGPAPLEVFTDGDCRLCRLSRAWTERRDRDGRLRFIDLRTAPSQALPAPRDALAAEIFVREPDGSLRSGFAAWRRLLRALPGWRWLAALLALPPMSWLGPPAYRWIARHRDRLPLPGHCRDESCRQPHPP